ncbi:cupin domain-containing protein [Jatrophihabitans sp.]|jgi:quercetin dioxygenase-like cupin family protein|uniref:cupin domain-containing protein n=1 Tax=Jatrophihabitans sp. TaxID=1932789 RepID=UPI002F254E3F
MRTFDSTSADSATVGPLEVARWEQYGLQATMPFGAMWYTVPAGGSSPRDCHPELELSIVIEGTAFVESNASTVELPRGSAILFDSAEPHVISNRDQRAPLTIFSAYWLPLEPTASSPAQAGTREEELASV